MMTPLSSFRFVDLQISHYNSPVYDLVYLLYCSTLPSTRRANYERLLNTYMETLYATLDMYGYPSDYQRITHEELRSEMSLLLTLKLFALALMNAVTTNESNGVFDMETALRTQGKEGLDPKVFSGLYKDRTAPDWKVIAEEIAAFDWTTDDPK